MTPSEVANVLETSGESIVATVGGLPPEAATWRPAPSEWCINECVGHLIETERRSFGGRIRTILASREPELETWDPAAVARSRGDCDRRPGELVSEFDALRQDSIQLVRSLREDQLSRGGAHPEVGRLTVGDLLHEWIHHDGNHLRQILGIVQAYVWPDMGNARRFTSTG